MLTRFDDRRRWFGTFFLILSGGMLAWGMTFLKSELMQRPILFVCYWAGCLTFTLLALIIALFDMAAVRRRSREEKRRLFNSAFQDVPDNGMPPLDHR